MAIRIARIGGPRKRGEGLRLGTVRRLPRGIRKEDYARKDYFDLWLPELAPSEKLVKWALSKPLEGPHWAAFVKRYRAEMKEPGPRRLLRLLARLSQESAFSVSCYCEIAERCHRSVLRDLLAEEGASIDAQSPHRRASRRPARKT